MDDNVALHIDSKGIEWIPIVFQGHMSIFKSHDGPKKCLIWLDLSDSCLFTLVWIYRWQWNTTHSSQKNNKGSDIFTRSSVNFQGYTGRKKGRLGPLFELFRMITLLWTYGWQWRFTYLGHWRGTVLFLEVISQIPKTKIDLPPNWVFLNSLCSE